MAFLGKIKKKKIWKSKIFWIIIILVIALGAGAVFLKRKQASNLKEALTGSIKSAEVTTGTISEDIEGSGTLSAADTKDVVVPVGITVDEVYVESGDQVTKGQKLCKLNETSIISALVDIESSLDTIDDKLDDDDDLTDLEIEELKAQRADLKEARETLNTLKENPVVKATRSGIISAVNVAENTETSQTGSASSSSSSSSAAYQSTSETNLKSITATKMVAKITPVTGMITYTSSESETSDESLQVTTLEDTGSDATTESTDATTETTESSEATTAATESSEATTAAAATEASAATTAAASSGTAAAGTTAAPKTTTKSASMPSAGSGSAASASSSASSGSGSSSIYSSYEMVAFQIMSMKKADVVISVDELDILSVEEGQSATVTLDAIEDEEFDGEITKVANTSSSSSGNAKYEVTIEIDMTDDMRIGMSATATIHVNTAENVLVIPIAALQQKGSSTFVYTQSDDQGNLSGEVEVTTGLSDSSQVEITSGLSEGDTVYYTRTDSDDDSEFSFGGGMMGGGEMPSGGGDFKGHGDGGGGNMPSPPSN